MMNIVKRSDKIAFLGVNGEFVRMRGFTEFSISKNPKEYSRQYIDEEADRTDITGYSPEISYSFDEMSDNDAHKHIIEITNKELTGVNAKVDIIIVDFNDNTSSDKYGAVKRSFSVIPDSEGDSMDAYTYSGTFKANGEKVFGTATSEDDWETCQFTEGA